MKQRIIALSLMDLTVTLSMNDTQYNDTHLEYRFNVIIPCVIKKSIPFLLFLMSFCWVSLSSVTLCRVSSCWKSLSWVSLC